MSTVVVRYRTKADRADENQQLVEKVFAELAETRPAGFRYLALRLGDGNSFVHIATELEEHGSSLAEVPAFQAFVAGIAHRCEEPPQPISARVIASYGIAE
jgi:hypothetical protein